MAEGEPAGTLAVDRPPIAALFLIEFDVKAGYTIAWKQAVRGLDLSGAVEYKSLPSGLHAVAEDLIYFVHEDDGASANAGEAGEEGGGGGGGGDDGQAGASEGGYAGLSAFVNLPTDEADARFARMIAVGVLVPRSYGRLGRAWRHADALLEMARKLAADRNETALLEAYWRDHSGPTPLPAGGDSPLSSPTTVAFRGSLAAGRRSHIRNRSASDGTALMLPPGHRLSSHHPAWSLTALLDTFGPLVFPIYRAALLRQRILISTHAPVREANNFVYNLSVLANIPLSVFDLLEPTAVPQQRIRPLFTIGVNDIPFLADDAAAAQRAAHAAAHGAPLGPYGGPGWVACTTDSILAMKGELWDVLITMPPPRSPLAAEDTPRVWPTVETAGRVPVRATQRDLRRFRALTSGLARLAGDVDGANSAQSAPSADATDAIVEPITWAALAYNGFLWWASAGEQRRAEDMEESIHDAALLADAVPRPTPETQGQQQAEPAQPADEADEDGRARLELAIVAYFHRLTTQMLSVLADVVESGGEDDEDDDEQAASGPYYDGDDDDDDDGTNGADDAESTDDLLARDADRGGLALLRRRGGRGAQRRGRLGLATPPVPTASAVAAATTTTRVPTDAVARMGLDVWSPADAVFVRDVALQYFGRRGVQVEGKGVEVCGLKVC